jgi:hypothetical protein
VTDPPDPDRGTPPASTPAGGPNGGDTPGTPQGGCLTSITTVAVGGLVLVSIVVGLFVGRCSAGDRSPPPAATVSVRESPSVITAIRDLARLETAQYHMERVIDLTETQRRFFGLVEAKDAILLIAAGDVTAGVDLAELRDEEIVVDETRRRIEITVPPAKILATRLDNERTYVHTRQTDTLAERRESLETEARQRAEQALAEAAKKGDILQRADRNAAKTLESLARSFGYREVVIKPRGALDESKLP